MENAASSSILQWSDAYCYAKCVYMGADNATSFSSSPPLIISPSTLVIITSMAALGYPGFGVPSYLNTDGAKANIHQQQKFWWIYLVYNKTKTKFNCHTELISYFITIFYFLIRLKWRNLKYSHFSEISKCIHNFSLMRQYFEKYNSHKSFRRP